MKEYTQHYHLERNHQGLGNELIEKPSDEIDVNALSSVGNDWAVSLKYYYRRAA